MKIKIDFITNSSSICFLIMAPQRITKKFIIENGVRPSVINDFKCITNLKKLIEYVDGQPCDWIRYARGPTRWWNLEEDWYFDAKEIIENGKAVVLIDIERNHEDVNFFENMILGRGCQIVRREAD